MNQMLTETHLPGKPLPAGNAKKFTDALSADIDQNTGKGEKARPSEIFYEPIYDRDKKVKDIKLLYRAFTDLLKSMGFMLLHDSKQPTYVRLTDNILEEVSTSRIQHIFLAYIETEHQPLEGVPRDMIIEKIHRCNTTLFSDSRLSLLYPDKPIQFQTDTATECFIYYANGVVRCSAEGIALLDYKHLGGVIWKKQQLNRVFTPMEWEQPYGSEEELVDGFGYFAKFMFRIAGSRMDRFYSLCAIAGYMLHCYFDYKLKAIILTDSKISDKADGRSGKTLFCQGLGKIRNYVEINGKDFDPANKHKYQTADMESQIVCLNDVRRNFQPENVFNDITEGLQVEKKNKQPFKIRPKMIISSNKTLNVEGTSALDRVLEYEVAERYSNVYSPADEFGHWFFSDWKAAQWNLFDNFMAFCACYFLRNGLREPAQINLLKRKLVDATSMDFVEFLDEKFNAGELTWNQDFKKEDVQSEFMRLNPDYVENKRFSTDRNFLKHLKHYCEANGGKYSSGRTTGVRWVHFGKEPERERK